MTLFIVVLPLRLTNPRQDFAAMFKAYLDANPAVGMRSSDCRADLQRMAELRRKICQGLYERDGYDEAREVVDDMHEYYNCLLECETKGIVGGNPQVTLEWESALTQESQVLGTLDWERANIIWNLAVLEAYAASKQPLDSKISWSKAAQHFQNAASWLQHIPPSVGHVFDFSDTFLEFWQALLMALSQRCVYESLACAPRPRHLLLAKLAAAAVPLFGEMETIVRQDEQSSSPMLMKTASLTNNWADYSLAWGMYMSSKAEYHQAVTSKEKKQWGQEIARLDLAFQFASLCSQYCERAPLISLQPLHKAVNADVQSLRNQLEAADRDNANVHQQPVPHRDELTEIRGEKLVDVDQPLTKLLKPMQGEPMFQGVSDTRHLQAYVDLFHSEMDRLMGQLSSVAEERTEAARTTLATVNLPHSLTAYAQEVNGGGIPIELWEKVQSIQRERRIAKLKQDMWELRDVADQARSNYRAIESQLEFDLESDRLFRQDNPGFEGHDATEVQRSFRESLNSYDRLLVTAQEGDSVLLKRLEQLDTNPRYKLLQFQKSQLDRLLPGSGGGGGGRQPIDTSHLSRLLVDLSGLFKERDVLLHSIQEEIQNYDIQGTLESRSGSGSEQELEDAVRFARKAFDGILYELKANLEKQTGLIDEILSENEHFMRSRDAQSGNAGSGESCIAMIEDAIDEIEQLSKHLSEGKGFYQVIIPKLEKLKHQVGDVSARLTVERLEYDDSIDQSRQEQADAAMAARMNDGAPAGGGPSAYPGRSQPRTHNTGPPPFCVDDEKVATLVAMEFDPAKVVEALTKHKNDIDQALNELLSF